MPIRATGYYLALAETWTPDHNTFLSWGYRFRLARRVTLSLHAQRESNQRESAPGIRVWPAARLPSLRCRSGGRLTRAVPGPLSLSPHPCGSSPCATPPLGLLTGTRAPSCRVVFLCAARIDRRHASHINLSNCQAALNAPSGG